jgi:hypothetical protein
MSRKSEFLAIVEPILEKKKVKQDATNLAVELSDILNKIDIGADGSGLTELKEVFNEQLTAMGKQPIVFSDNTLRGITAQFANAVSEGIKAGVASVDNEIAQLTKQRTSLLAERDALKKQMTNKTLKEELSKFDSLHAEPLKVSGDLKAEAIRIRKEFLSAYQDLQDFANDDGNFDARSDGFEKAVLNAQQKAKQLVRMQKTLATNTDPSLNIQRQKYAELVDGIEMEDVGVAFEALDDIFTDQIMRLEDIQSELQNVNIKIEELQKKKIDIISDDDKADISATLKSFEEIEAAHKRISTQKGKISTTPVKELNAALNQEQEFKSLTQLFNDYNKAFDTGADWEKLYTSAVRFVNQFETDLKSGQISKNRLPRYTELYDKLAPIANDARESLKLLAEFQPVKSQRGRKQSIEEDTNTAALHENN